MKRRAWAEAAGLTVHPTKTRIDLWSDHSGKPVVVEQPPMAKTDTADDWVQKAAEASDPQTKIEYLKKALALEPLHSKANRMLFQLEGAKSMRQDKPAPLGVSIEELAPLKKVSNKKKRGSTRCPVF